MTTVRRLPRYRDLRPLLGAGTSRPSRLERAVDLADVRELARRRIPRLVFDYVDGAAEDERSAAAARRAFDEVVFTPRVMRDVAQVDTATRVLGEPASMPLVLAPTGFTRMMHTAGEPAVAAAAGLAGVPYTLSTMGTTSPERLAAQSPRTDLWFQLYVWQDRVRSEELLARVSGAGFRVLVVTVDVPVAGARLRDDRNGLTVPPRLSARTLGSFARHPSWAIDALTTEPLSFASFSDKPADLTSLINTMFDPRVTWADIEWLRRQWSGPLVLKGIQHVDDAQRAVDSGADAVVLPNHGGRQLDRAITPLALLPDVVAAVSGRAEIYLDGGLRSGADIAAAVGLGADACLIGRPYLYGLMAGGQAGVQRVLDLFSTEFRRTMQLLGARDVSELRDRRVTARTGERLSLGPTLVEQPDGRAVAI